MILEVVAAEFAIVFGHRPEMEENSEIESRGGDIAAQLTPCRVSEAFSRFQFHDNSPLDEHVDAMKTDLLTAEPDGDRILAIDPKASLAHHNLERARIDRLDEAVSQLVVNIEEAAHNGVTELLLDNDGRGNVLAVFV